MRAVVHQVGRRRHSSFHLHLRNDGPEYIQLPCVYFHIDVEVLHLQRHGGSAEAGAVRGGKRTGYQLCPVLRLQRAAINVAL